MRGGGSRAAVLSNWGNQPGAPGLEPLAILLGFFCDITRDITRDITCDITRDITRDITCDMCDITRDKTRDITDLVFPETYIYIIYHVYTFISI